MEKKRLKKYIVIMILVLLACCMILVVILKQQKNSEKAKNEDQSYEEFIEQYAQETISPRNMIELFSYKGENDKDILYKNLRKFTEYISYLKKEIVEKDEEWQKSYFEKHYKEIMNTLGIQKQDDFIEFLAYIKLKNINVENFNYAEIETNSSNLNSKYFYFNIHFFYGENLEDVGFKVYFALQQSNPILVKYEPLN